MRKINNKAFTLIELLVVIAIIAVLVTIVIVAINPVRLIQNSQDARMRADLNQIKASMQLYYNDCKFYPNAIPASGSAWESVNASSCDDSTVYMRQFPANTAGGDYLYTPYKSDDTVCAAGETCTSYIVGAALNNPNTEDGYTAAKCGIVSTAFISGANFEVCND